MKLGTYKGSLIPKDSSSLLVYCFLGLSSVTTLLFFLMLANRAMLANIQFQMRSNQTFVQLNNGESLLVEKKPNWHRTDEVLRSVVEQWIRMTFEWDSQIPGEKARDPGVEMARNTQIPTKAYLASYLLESGGFRESYLDELVKVIPQSFFQTRIEGVVEIYSMSSPRQIAQGKWEIDVVSVLIEKLPRGENMRRFNRTFTLEARYLPQEVFEQKNETSFLRQKVFDLSKNGVIITNIQPL